MLLIVLLGGLVVLFLFLSISALGKSIEVAAIGAIVSLCFSLITALLIWVRIARRNDRVILHERGLAIYKIGEITIVTWEEIVNINRGEINRGRGPSIDTAPYLILKTSHGQKIKVGGSFSSVNGSMMEGGNELVTAIEECTFPYRWKQYVTDIERGAIVDFGKLSATRRGLTINRKEYSWSDVERISKHVTLVNGVGPTQVDFYIRGRQTPIHRLQLFQIVDYSILRGLHAVMAQASSESSR